MADLLRPTDLAKIQRDIETAKTLEYMKHTKVQAEEQKSLQDAFMEKDIHPEVKDRLNAAVRRAAEQGLHELQVITFPASYCNDRGRRINNSEPDWPSSLEGFAKRAYVFYDKELKPLDFRLRAAVLDYPGGMPGTIGMFLIW